MDNTTSEESGARQLSEVINYAIAAYKKELPASQIFTTTPTDANGWLARFIMEAIEHHRPDVQDVAPKLAAVVPPEYPTQAMRDAGNRKLTELQTEPGMGIADRAFYVWQAMYDAAPTAQQSEPGSSQRPTIEQIWEGYGVVLDSRDGVADALKAADKAMWNLLEFYQHDPKALAVVEECRSVVRGLQRRPARGV